MDAGRGASTCGGVGGVRDKGVLRRHHLLAQHCHLKRAVGQPRTAQAQHRAPVPLGSPHLLDGAPRGLPQAVLPCKACMKPRQASENIQWHAGHAAALDPLEQCQKKALTLVTLPLAWHALLSFQERLLPEEGHFYE